MSPPSLEVRLFASLVERAGGRRCLQVEVPPGTDVAGLWRLLCERHPALGETGFRPLAACDREYAGWDRVLDGVREVAFLPPVSGG